ncbi:hypothetical protein pdam_00020844 [Pocillopora damicornis]|uniref:Mediator of RNA polymerase II transcription subunit 29 n=1 Tax=Pocillopora damicornis TaxID=46731 RepID=A0A3M6TXR2_POCDA|nr:hypothetical protein pdam_00020844 [Pocillopora damicornis]
MASSNTAGSAIDAEYVGKLIKHAKDTLANVMRLANQAIDQNAEVDLGTTIWKNPLSPQEVPQGKKMHIRDGMFYHYLVPFYTCGLMRETASQTHDSGRYTPKPIFSSKTENVAETQTYSEYLSTVSTQIAATKELHDMLSEFSSAQLP